MNNVDKLIMVGNLPSRIKEGITMQEYKEANRVLVSLMTHKQKVRYAIHAAELVIDVFEKKYPKDKRPRKAIEAAKKWLKNPSKKNRAAAYAANAAAYAADAADAVANAAAYAAAYAAYVANAAANAANAAAYVANAAAYAAAYAAVNNKVKDKILLYGLKLLKIGG